MNQTKEFIDQAILRLHENTEKLEKCFAELNEEDVWKRPNDSSNSVGNIVLHLCGNITQYIISSLGGAEDQRNRDEEFAAREGHAKAELLRLLKKTVDESICVIGGLAEKDLIETRGVQGFELTGLGIVLHVVEHYSYHVGQIAFWIKLLKDKDLNLYAGIDLDVKNEPEGSRN